MLFRSLDQLVGRMVELNQEIAGDVANLGEGFVIGHSFFLPPAAPPDWLVWYADVIRQEIGPLLREYWFDDTAKAEQWIERLLAEW